MIIASKTDDVRGTEPRSLGAQHAVRVLDAAEWPLWDALVSKSPQGTVFHTTKWLKMTKTPFRIFGYYHHGGLTAGVVTEVVGPQAAGHSFHITNRANLPITNDITEWVASGITTNCPYLGVVLPPASGKYLTNLTFHRNILTALAEHLKHKFVSIHFRMGPEVNDLQPFIANGYSVGLLYTYIVPLQDLDVAWRNMEDKRRNDIRKAERDGITVDQEGSIKHLLPIVERMLVGKGYPVYISDIAVCRDEVLRPDGQSRCFISRNAAGEALAGVYMVWDQKCAYYLMGGYQTEGVHRGAGALAIWEAVRYAGSTLGLQRFDFLAATMPSIERFMRDFGGRLTPLYAVRWESPSFSRSLKKGFRGAVNTLRSCASKLRKP